MKLSLSRGSAARSRLGRQSVKRGLIVLKAGEPNYEAIIERAASENKLAIERAIAAMERSALENIKKSEVLVERALAENRQELLKFENLVERALAENCRKNEVLVERALAENRQELQKFEWALAENRQEFQKSAAENRLEFQKSAAENNKMSEVLVERALAENRQELLKCTAMLESKLQYTQYIVAGLFVLSVLLSSSAASSDSYLSRLLSTLTGFLFKR